MKKILSLLPVLLLTSCIIYPQPKVVIDDFSYGVFLGIEAEDKDKISKYETVVIDAQYFNGSDITSMKRNGQTVYSYLNVGSIEDFREYYDAFYDITFAEYENWDEERWVNVSQKKWQDFILYDLSDELLEKGVDGFFIDNVDVYYYSDENNDIYNGLCTILRGLKKKTYLSINGGDIFVTRYLKENKNIDDVMDGVNQETIFSKINWDDETFGENDKEETQYFKQYVETVAKEKKDVYLLEYTTDEKVIAKIKDYCLKHNFKYYISSTLELTI